MSCIAGNGDLCEKGESTSLFVETFLSVRVGIGEVRIAFAQLCYVVSDRLFAANAKVLAKTFEVEFDVAEFFNEVDEVERLGVDAMTFNGVEEFADLTRKSDAHVQEVGFGW